MKQLAVVSIVLLLVGCATTPPPPPLTQADIVSLAQAGVSDRDIIRRIDQTQTVFRLSADDIVRLQKQGVRQRVIDYMLQTWTDAAVLEQRRRYNDSLYYYDYAYPYPPPGEGPRMRLH